MDLFNEGQKISIFVEKEKKLVEITGVITSAYDDRLCIELPQYFMRYIALLDVGCCLTAKVFTKLGTIDFNSIVIQSPLDDQFVIELDYNAVKLTPGETLPIVNAIATLNIIRESGVKTVKTVEISTEYLKFYGEKSFKVGEEFACELFLPPVYGTIKFKATVEEIDPIYDNECKITYFNMTEYDRQTLLYFMYEYANSLKQERA